MFVPFMEEEEEGEGGDGRRTYSFVISEAFRIKSKVNANGFAQSFSLVLTK